MSKVLDPGLRMTYLRLPPHLLDTVVDTRRALGSTVAAPIQKAVTELIETDELARHIARVRKLYADRREALLGALTDVPSIVNIRGNEAASTSSRSSTSASMPRPNNAGTPQWPAHRRTRRISHSAQPRRSRPRPGLCPAHASAIRSAAAILATLRAITDVR